MPDIERLDRAVALLRELDALKTDLPETPRVWDRAIARGLDLGLAITLELIVAGVGSVAIMVIFWGGRDPNEFRDPSPAETAFAITLLVVWLGLLAWNEVVGFGPDRQTFGKRLLGIRVVLMHGDGVPGPRRMLGRWATAFFSSLLVLAAWGLVATRLPLSLRVPAMLAFLAIPAALFFGRSGRGLHDRIWGTRLIRPR